MNRIIRFLLSLLSGVLLSLAWFGLPGWILFVAFIPLLILDQYFIDRRDKFGSTAFWTHAFVAVLVWNALTTWWIAYATVAGAILAIAANAFLMSLILWLGHKARRTFMPNLGYISIIVFWLTFEYFHFHWDIEWPWLTLGNGFANNIRVIQWYEFTGFLGGSLWILIMNILLFRTGYLLTTKRKYFLYPALMFLLLLIVPVYISGNLYDNYEEKPNPRNVVIIQPNVNPYDESYDMAAENEKLERFVQLAEQLADDSTDFIVGPETVFERYPDWNEDRLEMNPQFRYLHKWMQQFEKAELVYGVSSSKRYVDRENAPVTARTRNNVTYDVFNSAIFMGRRGEPQVYHKSILVPGVEKMPFMNYLKFMNEIVIDLGGTSGSLGRQDEPSVFTANDGTQIAPVICYESVFGGYITKYVRKGAGLIFIITNDGWWRDTYGYRQHMSFARLRAIETRRSIARSANTGISCFINQRGDVYQATPWWTKTVVEGKVNVNDEMTFYVKYGDYLARISMFVSLLLVLLVISRNLQKR